AIYFDVSKDRLYTSATNSPDRRSAQAAMYQVLHALLRLSAPLLAFTSEEAWQFLRTEGDVESVHLAEFPKPEDFPLFTEDKLSNWEKLVDVREQVTKSLEGARQEKLIGAPLEASVQITAGSDLYPLLNEYQAQLPGLFIVSDVLLVQGNDSGVSVQV